MTLGLRTKFFLSQQYVPVREHQIISLGPKESETVRQHLAKKPLPCGVPSGCRRSNLFLLAPELLCRPRQKLPKLPLVNPNTLNWRHLTKTKLLVIGK